MFLGQLTTKQIFTGTETKKKLYRDLNQKRLRTPALQHLLQQVINKFCKPKKVSQFLTTLSLGTNLCFISATFFATFLIQLFCRRVYNYKILHIM